MPEKLGLLVTKSTEYPTACYECKEGMESALSLAGIETQWEYQDIGFGNNAEILQEKILKLSYEQRVKAIICLADNERNLLKWKELAATVKSSCWIASLGAYIDKYMDLPSNLYRHSHELWQLYWQAGYYLAQTYKDNVHLVAGFHESGYEMIYAFYKGIEAGGGVSPHLTVIKQMEDFSIFEQKNQNASFKAVFLALNGKEAKDFLSQYTQSSCANLPLYTSDWAWTKNPLFEIPNVYLFSFFEKNKETLLENHPLKQKLMEIENNASLFTLLGYECGLRYLAVTYPEKIAPSALQQNLHIVQNNTSFYLPVYLHQLFYQQQDLHSQLLNTFLPSSEINLLREVEKSSTGWLNPYLFS